MAIKLISLDMDGTLLNSQSEMQPSSIAALKKALRQGIKVVLASGRPIAGLKKYMEQLGIEGSAQYVITLNGAITRNADDDIIMEQLVPNRFYRKMTAFALAHHVPFNIVAADSRIITADHNVDPWVYQQAYENHAILYIRTPDEMEETDFQIAKGAFVGEPPVLDAVEPLVRKTFGKDLYVVRGDRNFLELLNPATSKGTALRKLCAVLKIKKQEVMAFGDQKNDIDSFDFAGIGVCMGNGDAETKKHADYVTASNDQDGISQALAKFVFNR